MVSLDGKIVKEINNIKTDGILKIENKFLQSGIYILNIYNLNSKLIFNKKIIVK